MTEPPLPELIGSQADPKQQRSLEVIALRFLLVPPVFWIISLIAILFLLESKDGYFRYLLALTSGGVASCEAIALFLGLRIWRSAGGCVVIVVSLLLGSLFGFLSYGFIFLFH